MTTEKNRLEAGAFFKYLYNHLFAVVTHMLVSAYMRISLEYLLKSIQEVEMSSPEVEG